MAKRKISVQSAKDKARRLQKMVAEKISDLLGIPWGKDEMIASREMGQSGVDVRLIGEAAEKFPFAIECKWQEKWDIPGWIRQAESNTSDKLPDWLLFVKKNRSDIYVMMKADTFFKIMELVLKHK